jgi:predicted short-subunit dehydrogenase-like oxidoreductase (DUF2520 family)
MKILIAGTGNVALALGKAFTGAGHTLIGITGRDAVKTGIAASKLNTAAFPGFSKLPLSADLIVIAVKDDAIADVVKRLPSFRGTVVHTSGSTPMELLKKFKRHGVLWPVATIPKPRKGQFTKVPFVIESNHEKSTTLLMQAVHSLSGETYLLDSEQRKVLHLAAVVVNNFTNYLLTVAEDILRKESLPFEILHKLSESTVQNAFKAGAKVSQTGPARRNDHKTMDLHLKYLAGNKDYARLYRMISELITRVHKEQVKS